MKYAFYIVLMFMVVGCGNGKNYSAQEDEAFERLRQIIDDKKLEIKSYFARPMATTAFMQVANTNILGPGNTASSIDIASNSNGFKIDGDTISGYFPYYGEQRFGGSYPGTNHQGIEFKSVPKDYKVSVNESKHVVNVRFNIEDQFRSNETYDIFITLYPNKRSNIQINSSHRTPIEFTGTMKVLREDKVTVK
ncbi:DUF4251 domain-containing protein [Subsaxibacter sp. CAU 1640]|uniref:DUF4251 domain-containing protein n=1 Tax=Subsaxibacter sp. CAU 1640 TaxID=2933271 RepID=UPI00200479BA|nr:DUF4251 domain-containing protein [Subsaxibacter sp. CAU 1640]MCK7590977.1 DUF4251 domain-containing protein [Subsaxibacter sp. CAU 1640]